jgi:Zn-dependent M16 (insulinase) family peptidase
LLPQVHFSNPGDETNAFSVHFKTVPQDSTGIAHILEHVTLCGSEK